MRNLRPVNKDPLEIKHEKFNPFYKIQITGKNDQHVIISTYTEYVSTDTQIMNWSN